MPVGDHDLVHHAESLQQTALVIIRDGGLAAFVMPKDLGRCERYDQVVAEGAGLLEKLEVARMKNIIAA